MAEPERVVDFTPKFTSRPVRTSYADDSPEPVSPARQFAAPAEARVKSDARKPSRLLVAGLVTALLVTGVALVNQSRKVMRLSREVAGLEASLAAATSAVSAYEIRFERVRDQVGDLVSRVGVLNGLVARDVVDITLSGTPSGAPGAARPADPAGPSR